MGDARRGLAEGGDLVHSSKFKVHSNGLGACTAQNEAKITGWISSEHLACFFTPSPTGAQGSPPLARLIFIHKLPCPTPGGPELAPYCEAGGLTHSFWCWAYAIRPYGVHSPFGGCLPFLRHAVGAYRIRPTPRGCKSSRPNCHTIMSRHAVSLMLLLLAWERGCITSPATPRQ